MNLITILGAVIALVALIVSFWRWEAERIRRQNERHKAILLGINWLISKAEDKPDLYVLDRIRNALKEDD